MVISNPILFLLTCLGCVVEVVLKMATFIVFLSAAFVVDPLYRQTTAKFDEGGAKGLLMNNLGVYGACRVLFDSQEVPAKCMASQNQSDTSDTIDLSFVRGVLKNMLKLLLHLQKIRSMWTMMPYFSV